MGVSSRRSISSPRRASALIVTMGSLAILALLAVVFASLSISERNVSRSHADQVRARIYAMSGIEAAAARIRRHLLSPTPSGSTAAFSVAEGSNTPWIYDGSLRLGSLAAVEDATLCSFQTDYLPIADHYNADSFDAAGSLAHPRNNLTGVTSYFPGTYFFADESLRVDLPEPPLGSTPYPTSFPVGAAAPAARFQPTRPRTGDIVTIRVVDTGSQFYVNGRDPLPSQRWQFPTGTPEFTPLPAKWVTLLNRLGRVLSSPTFPAPPSGLDLAPLSPIRCPHGHTLSDEGANIGTRLDGIRKMLRRNIVMKTEMLRGAGDPYSFYGADPSSAGFHDYEIVSQFLSTFNWVDPTTLDPGRLQHMRANDPTLFYSPTGADGTGAAACLPTLGPPAPGEEWLRSSDDPLASSGAFSLASVTLAAVGAPPFASCAADRLVNQRNAGSIFHAGNDQFGPPLLTYEPASPAGPGAWPPKYPDAASCLEPRAPLNVNTAPYWSLRACMEGITAAFWDRQSALLWTVETQHIRANYDGPGYTGAQREMIPAPLAHFVACHIIAKRERRGPYSTPPPDNPADPANSLLPGEPGYALPAGRFPGGPFRTWIEWYRFVDFVTEQAGSPFSSDANRRSAQKGILKANANPNSHINKFNPDECFESRFGDVDKADLDTWSTEFCFRSNGYFEIDSVGRVLANPGGATPPRLVVVAEQRMSAIVQAYEVVKHSTQDQFHRRRVESLDIQTYPEQVNSHGNATGDPREWGTVTARPVGSPNAFDRAAEWDGYLGVAAADYGGAGPPAANVWHYTSNLGAYRGTAECARSVVDGTGLPNPNSEGPQSELFPDGYFAHEARRYPGSALLPNRIFGWGTPRVEEPVDEFVRYPQTGGEPVPGARPLRIDLGAGTIEMWVKPTWTAMNFPSGDYGMPAPIDPKFDIGSAGHQHPMGEGTRTFATYGDTDGHPLGFVKGTKRLALAAQRIGYSPKSNLGNMNVPGGNDGNPGVFLITARKGNTTQGFNFPTGPPCANYYWNDAVPQWGKYFLNAMPVPVKTSDPADPRSWGFSGRWHHLALVWKSNGAESWLLVDGLYSPAGRVVAWDSATGNVDSNWSLFIGCNRFRDRESNGYPCNADATIDGVKLHDRDVYPAAPLNPAPPRYRTGSGPFYRGRMLLGSEIEAMGGAGWIVSLSWTGWFPNYSTQNQAATFSVTNGSQRMVLPTAVSGSQGKGLLLETGPGKFLGVNSNDALDYQIDMRLEGTFVVGTPLIDDVTITFVPTANRYLSYSFSNR